MKSKGNDMGRFSVELEITNNSDLVLAEHGHLDPTKIRRTVIAGVVDPGATKLVLPEALVKEMGFPLWNAKIKVQYADGRRSLRQEVGGVYVRLQGRDGIFTAIAEPRRTTALIGAILLEELDFLVDCKKMRLVPRDPHYKLSEME